MSEGAPLSAGLGATLADMDINAKQAAELQPLVVKLQEQIKSGRPWSGDSQLNENTLQAVANGAANTYELSELVVALDRADSSKDFLRELLATAFAHGFNSGVTYASD